MNNQVSFLGGRCDAIDRHAALGHHFFQIPVAERIAAVAPHRPQNDLAREITTQDGAVIWS